MDLSLKTTADRYDSIDGLRAYSALGIVAMHVLANGAYELDGFLFQNLIPALTDLVFLFMMISSFSMCCGYYEKMLHGKIALSEFYARRYAKIWPFFAMLVALDLIISPSLASLIEAFANLTMCFALLPNPQISVIGVAWTLGVIFVFYLLFPFFCFLLENRKRGWLVFGVSVLMNRVCSMYFFDENHMLLSFSGRSNILYNAVFFIAGGMIYLYRKEIVKLFALRMRWWLLLPAAICGALYFRWTKDCVLMAILFASLLMFSLCLGNQKGLLNNRYTKFLSTISMEIYLCHMVIFRVLEKIGGLHVFRSELLSYCAAFVLTLAGAIAFSCAAKWGITRMSKFPVKMK